MAAAVISAQSGKAIVSTGTGVQRAYGSNLTAGSMVWVSASKYNGSSDVFVAGDCIQQAGTAVLGPIDLDDQHELLTSGGGRIAVGQWSCLVLTGGSCTMRVQGALASSYIDLFSTEITGTWDASRKENANRGGSGTASQTAASSGNVVSANGGIIMGCLVVDTGVSSYVMTQDGAFTEVGSENDGTVNIAGEAIYRVLSGADTDDASWVIGSANAGWAANAVAYREAGVNNQLAWIIA